VNDDFGLAGTADGGISFLTPKIILAAQAKGREKYFGHRVFKITEQFHVWYNKLSKDEFKFLEMAFNFANRFLPSRSFLGVDIGTTSIKIIELKKSGGGAEVANYAFLESYGYLERPNNAIQTSSLKILERQTIELLKIALKKSDPKSRDAVASIPAFAAFVTLLDLPKMPDEEMLKAMKFQAKQYIPLPISEVTIDWVRAGERRDEKGNVTQQILLISVPNEYIQKYKNIFQGAGLNLTALEIEGLSIARALTRDIEEPLLIIDIGARSTAFSVAKKGGLKIAGQIDFAGSSFTQTISSGLNIPLAKAEDLKKQRGLKGVGGEYELSTLMLPILDVIIKEARRVKEGYESKYGEPLKQVILAGGGANLLGISDYIQGEMGLPTKKANPFSRVKYGAKLDPLANDLGPEFAVAIGLGLRRFK